LEKVPSSLVNVQTFFTGCLPVPDPVLPNHPRYIPHAGLLQERGHIKGGQDQEARVWGPGVGAFQYGRSRKASDRVPANNQLKPAKSTNQKGHFREKGGTRDS